jgi:hypothetical protein
MAYPLDARVDTREESVQTLEWEMILDTLSPW